MTQGLAYLSGFRNHWETEAEANTLPQGQNNPQQVARGLYAEQISGSAFTRCRHENLRSWLYRIQPSVTQGPFTPYSQAHFVDIATETNPNPMRWDPLSFPEEPHDFMSGLRPWLKQAAPIEQLGGTIFLYTANTDMVNHYVYSADGEWLIIPQQGRLKCLTEMGILIVGPGEILLLPRGIKCQIKLLDKQARGYLCENHGEPFKLPDLGPIGANGLANPRDFLAPTAAYEERRGDFKLFCKMNHQWFVASIDHSPLDVVAWHGNYAPMKYNLAHFCTINTVSFDHPDPSIFTVLTSPGLISGMASIDFVIFPPRWMVAEHTFRPPYFHRNVMSEYMGLIEGKYDAKQGGFLPGGGSLHNAMTAHGPDAKTYQEAIEAKLEPQKQVETLAFMLESQFIWQPTKAALQAPTYQKDYLACWEGL